MGTKQDEVKSSEKANLEMARDILDAYQKGDDRSLVIGWAVRLAGHLIALDARSRAPSIQSALPPSSARERRMREALDEARLQIEYLHDKFQPTSTGVAVLARITAAISSDGRGREDGK